MNSNGQIEVPAITALCKLSASVSPGGNIDNSEISDHSQHKILAGDAKGQVNLVDLPSKKIIDSFQVPECEGRRVESLTSATVEWVGTQLTYVAVVVRGCPVVHIILFKHNENKLRLLHTVNMCPDLANPTNLESNPG